MACEENWRECVKWLTRMGLLASDHRTNLPTATIRELAYTLRDGVQLCRLLTLISPGSLDLKDISQRPQMAQFLCLRNIRTFLQCCKAQFGLQDADLFAPGMLFDLSDFGKVLHTLSKLSTCPKALHSGVPGFSASQVDGEAAPLLDEEMCQNLEELASGEGGEEEDYYSLVVGTSTTEEDIYQDLCYIDRQPRQPPVTLREKRDYVKGELVETESNYLDALNMIKKAFLKPLWACLRDDDRKIIFFGIKELADIHTSFLSDLNRAVVGSGPTPPAASYPYAAHTHKTLGDVFCGWREKFVIYGDYCANLPRAQALVEEVCAKQEAVAAEVVKCEAAVKEGRFKLRDVLSVPMQRVLKYHLLLQKLLDETNREQHGAEEYRSIERARDAMTDVAEWTNEVKRDSETLQIIRQIEGSIYDLKMPDGMELKDYGRLQRDGELRIRGHDDNRLKSRYVFIFDKVMLMCKPTRMVDKLFGGEQYSYKHSLCLQEYRVEDVPSTLGTGKRAGGLARWSHSWNLVHHREKNVYTMYAHTEEHKRRWIKAIEDALTNIQPEECRSTDHHWTMHTFAKATNCSACGRFLKGLFYQGYRCVRCHSGAHRLCIGELAKCGLVHPPELPPRPPLLLPIPPQPESTTPEPLQLQSPVVEVGGGGSLTRSPRRTSSTSSAGGKVAQSPSSPPLPMNNINSPYTSNGMMRSGSAGSMGGGGNHHYVNLNQLESYPWYAGEMDRDTATGVLMDTTQSNGAFLVRVRPATVSAQGAPVDATYALSLRWSDQVKHMKILVTRDGSLFYLSESRYFKSVVELINWYTHNSLAESFSGLDARLERPFVRPGVDYGAGIVHFDYSTRTPSISSLPGALSASPATQPVPGTPS